MGGCLPVAQMSAAGLFSGDVLVHDGLQGAVSLQLFQNGVDSVLQRRVLCHAEEDYAIGMAKGSSLEAAVNAALEELKADGTLQSIVDKYITAE